MLTLSSMVAVGWDVGVGVGGAVATSDDKVGTMTTLELSDPVL